MKKIIFLLLATSLTANAWLWWRVPEVSRKSAGAVAVVTKPALVAAPVWAAEVVRPLVALDTADLATVREALRAAGVDESSVRGVIDGALRQRHKQQITAWRVERWNTAWWRGGLNATGGPKMPSLRELVHDPMRALLGRDALDVADAEVRYDFLPPDKRQKLAAIDLDYNELRARVPAGRSGQPATKSEQDEQQLLAAERRKDVLAVLTEAERAEYELRFSAAAAQNGRRFAAIKVTEQEFRAIQPLLAAMREQMAALPNRQVQAPERVELEQRTIDQIVAAVGYDRALDFIWGMDSGPYATTVRVLREVDRPAANAARLLQLAAETGEQAAAIHSDAALTVEQKREALSALQQTVRPQLDALVPPEVQPKLEEHAIGWFALLGEGRYAPRPATLVGSGFMMASPLAVSAPTSGGRVVVPVARAPGR